LHCLTIRLQTRLHKRRPLLITNNVVSVPVPQFGGGRRYQKGTNLISLLRIHTQAQDEDRMSKKNGLTDPSRLKPVSADDKQLLRVVIETPKGSRNKFAYDVEERIFELKKVLPAGMTFPYDFGFVPSTEADDGDAVDVLVLMDEPAFPGCALKCRPIGVIEGEQGSKKGGERNDRIIAVEKDAHSWAT